MTGNQGDDNRIVGFCYQRPTASIYQATNGHDATPPPPGWGPRRPPPGGNGGADHQAATLRGDTDAAVAFLERLPPPWQLIAIHPERGEIDPATGERYRPDVGTYTLPGAALHRPLARQAEHLLRDQSHQTRGEQKNAAKEETTDLLMLHTDVDPPKTPGIDLAMEQAHILDRLKSYDPPPSMIIASGGGYWGLWLLREPVPVRAADHIVKLEAYNIALEQALGGDNCHNIDRITRLPGTINLLDKLKREAGRVPALATLVSFDPERLYTLDDFTPAPASASTRERKADSGKTKTGNTNSKSGHTDTGHGADARPRFAPELRETIRRGQDPQNPRSWASRSEAVFYVGCELARAWWTDAQIAAELLDQRNGISEHISHREELAAELGAVQKLTRRRHRVLRDIEQVGNVRRFVLVEVMPVAVLPLIALGGVPRQRLTGMLDGTLDRAMRVALIIGGSRVPSLMLLG